MLRVGYKALELLNKQIEEGIDADGKPYSYSTSPFARPAGGTQIKDFKGSESDGKIKPFRTKKGVLWMVVTGGYRSYRELSGKKPDGDFLTFTGAMLQAMSVRSGSSRTAEIYFTDEVQAQKAFYLTVGGAGVGRKRWNFFNLTDENVDILTEYAAEQMTNDDIAEMFGFSDSV